jgi:hypothetical protein
MSQATEKELPPAAVLVRDMAALRARQLESGAREADRRRMSAAARRYLEEHGAHDLTAVLAASTDGARDAEVRSLARYVAAASLDGDAVTVGGYAFLVPRGQE